MPKHTRIIKHKKRGRVCSGCVTPRTIAPALSRIHSPRVSLPSSPLPEDKLSSLQAFHQSLKPTKKGARRLYSRSLSANICLHIVYAFTSLQPALPLARQRPSCSSSVGLSNKLLCPCTEFSQRTQVLTAMVLSRGEED